MISVAAAVCSRLFYYSLLMGIKISSKISCYKGCCKTKLPEKFIVDGHGFEKRNVKLEMYFGLETGS